MKNFKMKLIGAALILLGMIITVYGLFFHSGPSTFWSIYIGMAVVMMGLGMLGFNVGQSF